MNKLNYILYDIEDAKKIILEKKTNINLYPLTPDTFNLVKKNTNNCNIFNPINKEIDEIHEKIITITRKFNDKYYNYIRKNSIEYFFLFYGINQIIILLIPISIYLSDFLPQKGPWILNINNEWKKYDELILIHLALLKKISKGHRIPNISYKYNYITNFILKRISKLIIFIIRKEKKYIFSGKGYGLNNLSKIFFEKSKNIKILQLNHSHRFPLIYSLKNFIKCFFNYYDLSLFLPQTSKKKYLLNDLDFINKICDNAYINNILKAYSQQIIEYSRNIENLIDVDNFYLKHLNPNYIISDQFRLLTSFALGFSSHNLNIKNILISQGTHVFNSNEISDYANYLNSLGVLLSPYAKTTLLQSPLAYKFLSNQKTGYDFEKTEPIMWGYNKYKHKDEFNNIYIMHAGSYKILSQRPWMYETSNEYVRGLSSLIDVINEIPKIKLIIRFRPKNELSIDTLRSLLPKSEKYEVSVNNNLIEDIKKSFLLVSFSSTVIEESIQYRMPVLLWGGTNRYKHINVNHFLPNQNKRHCVYTTNKKNKLKILIENIIKYHFSEPLKNEEINDYIWQNNYLSKEKFVDKVINEEF